MDIFAGKLPILKICATQSRSKLTDCSVNVEALTSILQQSGLLNEKDKDKFLSLAEALHNGSLLELWQKFLSRSMTVDKQEYAIQYAESILRLNNPDRAKFKDSNFTPTIEQFCGIDLAHNTLVCIERQLNMMLALSARNQLNPVFYPYLMGQKNPLFETDENQIQQNYQLIDQKVPIDEGAKKTISYWWENTPAGAQYFLKYVPLQKELANTLIANRHRVLGVVATHDDRLVSRHPYHRRPSGRNGR